MNILIVKTSAIGDVIQTFAVLDYLRARYPHARIDWVVESASLPLLQAHPQLTHVLELRLRRWKKALFSFATCKEVFKFIKHLRSVHYDILFDLQGNTKSGCITALARARAKVGFTAAGVREWPNVLFTSHKYESACAPNVRLKAVSIVQQHFHDKKAFTPHPLHLSLCAHESHRLQQILGVEKRPRLMVCFGSRWKNKRLPPPLLRALCEKITARYAPFYFFVFSTPEEERIAKDLAAHFAPHSEALGHMSLPLWQAVMWGCQGVIALDSAALHLCGTTATPSWGLFGPTQASMYQPLGEKHTAYQAPCPYKRTFSERCPVLRTCPTGACLHEVDPEVLFAQFQEVFAPLWAP